MDGIELGKHFRSQGMTVLLGIVGSASATRCRWLRPVTCVEIVKRALHVDAPHVLTPAQLHAELIRPSRGRERFRPLEELLRTA